VTPHTYAALVPAPESARAMLDEAARWYLDVSAGRALLSARTVVVDPPPGGWAAFATSRTSCREGAAAVVESLAGDARLLVGGVVLVVVPDGVDVHPHTWRFARGGVHLGGRRWCRRYAAVGERAPLGAYVHELGHLVWGWPDLAGRAGIGSHCLMATGALVDGGHAPSPPCPPLRVAAGWEDPIPVDPATTVAHLAERSGRVGRAGHLLVEVRHGHLLAYATDPPRLVVDLAPVHAARPVLGVLDWAGALA